MDQKLLLKAIIKLIAVLIWCFATLSLVLGLGCAADLLWNTFGGYLVGFDTSWSIPLLYIGSAAVLFFVGAVAWKYQRAR